MYNKGITTNATYPFVGSTGSCRTVLNIFKLKTYAAVSSGCSAISTALASQPLAVGVDATNWAPYTGGIYNNCNASNYTLNHNVLLVGQTPDYWTVKNSYGTQWGEAGFMRLAPGDTCGVCDSVFFPTV
jgi:cathepsin L